MIKVCRFCPQAANGDIAIANHERSNHPKLYWQSKADTCRAQAKRLMDEAARYDLKSQS